MNKKLPIDPNTITIAETAKILGVSKRTLQRWVKAGKLCAIRPNSKECYFSIEEIEKHRQNDLLTVEEAAKRLGVTIEEFLELGSKGLINRIVKTEGQVGYSRDSVEQLLHTLFYMQQKATHDHASSLQKVAKQRDPDKLIELLAAESAADDPVEQRIIGTVVSQNSHYIHKLQLFQRILLLTGLSIAVFFTVMVLVITLFFLIVPEETAQFFGYNYGTSFPKLAKHQVLGAHVSTDGKHGSNMFGAILKPFSKVALALVKQIDEEKHNKIVPEKTIADVNDILTIDIEGNIVPRGNFKLPDSSFLVTSDGELVEKLKAELRGYAASLSEKKETVIVEKEPAATVNTSIDILPGQITSSALAIGAVTTESIADGAVTGVKLESGIGLLGDSAVSSAFIKDGEVQGEDIADGAVTDSKLGQITTGNKVAGSAVQLSAGGGITDDGGLSLIQTCTDGQVLTWNALSADWECNSIAGGGGDITAVTAGTGLSGGGTTGAITLHAILGDSVDLTSEVTGVLPVSNGGTGTNTLNDLITLGTHTTGNYVGTVTGGSGIAIGGSAGEAWAPSVALGALTGDWNQSGAFDVVLGHASSELRVLESAGGTFHGTFDVGDLSADQTYTFGIGGTVYTSGNDPFDTTGEIQAVTTGGDVSGAISNIQIGSGAVGTAEVAGLDISDDTNLSASDGISLTDDALTNTDKGSTQNIFKTFAVSGQSNVVSDANSDALTLVAGSNVSITTDASTDTITITATDSNTTYSAGNDLDLTGTTFDLESVIDTVSTINLAGTGTLNGLDAIDATSESTIESAIDTLGSLTSATSLASVGTLTSGGTGAGFTLNFGTSTLSGNITGSNIDESTLSGLSSSNFTSANVSQWTNDAGYINDGNTNWNNSYGFITASSTDTLTNKSGNISQWTNDSGYLTTVDVSGNTNLSASNGVTLSGDGLSLDQAYTPTWTGLHTFTRANTQLLLKPASAPSANTKLVDVQQTGAGTTVFSIDYEGDVSATSLSLTTALTDANVADALTISSSGSVDAGALTGTIASARLSGTYGIDISGNAATVTNGVYTSGSYSDPSWITGLAGSKVSGNISGNAANVTGTVGDSNVADALTISGGTVDNSVIGGTNAAAGTFTVLTANGNTVLGDGTGNDSITIRKNGTGNVVLTGFATCTSLETDGSGNLTCGTDDGGVSYTAGNDLDLNGSAFDLESTIDTVSTINLSGTGTLNGLDAIDATTESTIEAAIDSLSNLTSVGTLTSGATGTGFTIDFANSTLSGNVTGANVASLDISDDTNLSASSGVTLTGDALSATLGTSIDTVEIDADTITLADIANSLTLDNNITFASNNATNDYKLILDNSSTGDIAELFEITTSGTGATVATALDLSDADIATALALGSNDITVGGVTIDATEFARLNGLDAAILDASDAVATAITGTGTLTAGSTGAGFTLNFGTSTLSGDITGSNISNVDVSSDTNLSASDGVSLTGDALTNTDKGSSQNIFKTLAVSGQNNVVTDTNGDTITLVAGSNVTITTDDTTDTITIAAAGGGSYTAGNDLDLNGSAFDLESTIDTVSTINLSGTGTLNGLDAIDATSESTIEAALDTLSNVTTVGTLTGGATGTGFTIDFANSTLSGNVTGANISGVDVSSDTNLSATDGVTLTGDALSLASTTGGGGLTYTTGVLAVGAGTGISVAADSISATLGTSIDTAEVDADTLTLADIANSLTLDNNLTFVSDSATNDYKLVFDNSSTGDIAALLQVTTSGTGATIAMALDLADADIVTSLALGSNDVTVGGVTIDATEFARLNGVDAALLDTSDAVATAITGTGTLTAGATGTGFTLNFGTSTLSGDITGSNISSLDISNDTNLSASDGITLTGDALTNSDKGSTQNIFKTIAVSGQSDVLTDANGDTLTFAAGTNVTLTTNAGTDTITINATDTDTTYSAGNDLDLTSTTFALETTLDFVDTINLAGTGTLNGLDVIDATTESTIEGAIDALANLTTLTIGGDTITDFVGTGLQLSGSTLIATLGTSIANTELDNDTVDFDKLSDGLTLDAGTSIALSNFDLTLGTNAGNGTVRISPNAGGQAALIIDKNGANDILAASASGSTRFVVSNAGNLAIEGGLSDLTDATLNISDALSVAGALTIAGNVVDSAGNIVLNDTVDIGGANGLRVDTTGAIIDIDGTVVVINDDLSISGGDITGANSDFIDIAEVADATFTFTRNDAGVVTLTSADNNADADLTVSAGGTGALTLGDSGSTTAITSSDWAIGATGAVTGIALDANGTGNAITNIEPGDLSTQGTETDEFCLTRETTAGAPFEWQSCGGAGGGITTVRESDASPSVGTLSTLEFGPASTSSDEFIVTDQTGGVARVQIGNQVAMLNQAETITGGWTFNTAATTFSTAINANGGITFDNASDTLGAFTMGGNIIGGSFIITDIGSTGTDFTTNGALAITLDGAETALTVDNAANASSIFVAEDNNGAVFTIADGGIVTATANINADGGIDVDDVFAVANGGNLTTSGTIDANGQIDLGDNGETVSIDSNDWDISTTGALTGISFDANGSGNSISNIETADILNGTLDADDLDQATEDGAPADGECLKFEDSGGGDFKWDTCAAGGGSQTPWTADIDADGFDVADLSNVLFRETTGAPAGTDVGLYRDNSGDLNANVLTGKGLNIQVNGTDEYNFTSSAFTIGTNDIVTGATTIASTELDRLDGKDAALVDQNDFTSGDGAGGTSSGSGLEAGTGGIGLLQGCADNEILKWNEASSVWECGSDRATVQIRKTADEVSGTSNTTLQDDNEMTFPIGANETWVVQINYVYTTNSVATNDIRVGLNNTATGATCVYQVADTAHAGNFNAGSTACNTALVVATTATGTKGGILSGTVTSGAGTGTVAFRFAQGTSDATNQTTVKAGSAMRAYKVSGADLAEVYYTKEADIGPGTVMILDPTFAAGVKKSVKGYDKNLVGVVTTQPGLVIGDSAGANAGSPTLIALSGRVPVKVSTENGIIRAGDFLTSSSIPGVAMRATKAGTIIGQAMNEFTGEGVGSVVVFVKSGQSNGSGISALIQGLNQDTQSEPTDVGKAVLASFLNEHREEAAIDVSEILTDRIAAGIEVITPRIVADEIIARSIKADRIEGFEIYTDKLASLEEAVLGLQSVWVPSTASSSGVILGSVATPESQNSLQDYVRPARPSVGDSGQAGMMDGEVALESLFVDGVATISGQLTTDRVRIKESLLVETSANIADTLMTARLIVSDLATFFGKVVFKSDVKIDGKLAVGEDTAGIATVKKGTDEVEIKFSEAYEDKPIVTISLNVDENEDTLETLLLQSDIKYIITKRSKNGFIIKLNQKAPEDIRFSWTAVEQNKDVVGNPIPTKAVDEQHYVTPTIVISAPPLEPTPTQ